MLNVKTWIWGVVLASGVWPLTVGAVNGVVEINHDAVMAGGLTEDLQTNCVDGPGYPATLCTPGSYVLTGDLVVPAGTSGIWLQTDDVSLDLNGFRVTGPYLCDSSSCSSSVAGSGIERVFIPPASVGGHRVSVFNGAIRGFGGNCLLLEDHAHVERLLTADCGARGINVGGHSIVTSNRVFSVGLEGIDLRGEGSVYTHNTVTDASLRVGQNLPAIAGGLPTGGNYCDDGSCSSDGRRRFYLTIGSFTAAQALLACAPGYHFASLFEILDPTVLEYETRLGRTADDSGRGPVTRVSGWVRTGHGDSASTAGTIVANCQAWVSTSANHDGFRVRLETQWATTTTEPWTLETSVPCTTASAVWCVED